MTNTFIIFTLLYCFLVSSIYGRTLTFFSMNDNAVVSPSPAPNADIDHAYVDHYGHVPSTSHRHNAKYNPTPSPSHSYSHTAEYSPAPSPSHSHSAEYSPAPIPSHSHNAEYSPAPSLSHSHNAEYSPAPIPSHGHNAEYSPVPSPSHSHNAKYSPAPSLSHSHNVEYSPAPSPCHSHNVKYSPAPSLSHSHNVEYSPAPSPGQVGSGSTSGQGANVYDVRSFGAIGDGSTDDTAAFKSAWDTACQVESGSAKIVAPRGFSFLLQPLIFTGPCKSELVFQVEGTIVPPDGPESWPKKISKKQWLIFYRTHGLIFQGSGLIDGRGEKWWNLPCKPHKGINGTTLPGPCDSPVAIRFFGCTNLTVRGIKFINSPEFHIRFDACQNVHVDSLIIKSPGNSPNTDGIHVENTNDVTIYNSVISNGDDCISIGAGSHNLDIRNVTCGPSHGISIGSLGVHNSKACVSNITVSNCVIKHSDNGVRIKTWQGGSGSVSDITFDRIRMDTVRNPVMIDQYYCLSRNCSNQTSAVSIASVSYSNIKGTYDPRGPPVHLACSDAVPCTNITISGLDLKPASATGLVSTHKHESFEEPFCWNAYGSLGAFTTPPIYCLLEGLPLDVPGLDVGLC